MVAIEGYRKFTITLIGMFLAASLAYIGKLDGNAAMVLMAGIGAFNYANYKTTSTEDS